MHGLTERKTKNKETRGKKEDKVKEKKTKSTG
jgi:hypothetical protein